jgi:hypothetical protein
VLVIPSLKIAYEEIVHQADLKKVKNLRKIVIFTSPDLAMWILDVTMEVSIIIELSNGLYDHK